MKILESAVTVTKTHEIYKIHAKVSKTCCKLDLTKR